MKQLWSAVILLGVMILLLAWNSHHLTCLIQAFQQDLDQAAQAVQQEDWKRAEELTRKVSNQWREAVSYFYLVQSHRDIDEVSVLLEESLAYVSTESARTYSALNARIQGAMEGICRMERFSLGNLI